MPQRRRGWYGRRKKKKYTTFKPPIRPQKLQPTMKPIPSPRSTKDKIFDFVAAHAGQVETASDIFSLISLLGGPIGGAGMWVGKKLARGAATYIGREMARTGLGVGGRFMPGIRYYTGATPWANNAANYAYGKLVDQGGKVAQGMTGIGKSTSIPGFLLEQAGAMGAKQARNRIQNTIISPIARRLRGMRGPRTGEMPFQSPQTQPFVAPYQQFNLDGTAMTPLFNREGVFLPQKYTAKGMPRLRGG